MTTVHSSVPSHVLPRPVRPYVPAGVAGVPRKNSTKSVSSTPVLSSFAIDLIAQFDSYRINMRESLQREVEENIHKAKVLKEAMKESSDRDAEIMMSADEQEYRTPSNRSNTSLNKNQGQTQHQNGDANGLHHGKSANGNAHGAAPQKRSTLDRIFGRKTSSNSHNSSLRNHQVTPHPPPSQDPAAVNLQDLNYLPVEEEEEEEVRDRSMGISGAGVGGSNGPATAGTEVKLHPTRAKAFSLPKSLKNLKRRIAALRAKGTDLDAERREKEERQRAANGGSNVEEKKRFTIIRLLPWKKSPASTVQNSPSSAPVRA